MVSQGPTDRTDGAEGGDGHVGDHFGDGEDPERTPQAHLSDRESNAKEKDRPENVEQARDVAAIDRVELVLRASFATVITERFCFSDERLSSFRIRAHGIV